MTPFARGLVAICLIAAASFFGPSWLALAALVGGLVWVAWENRRQE